MDSLETMTTWKQARGLAAGFKLGKRLRSHPRQFATGFCIQGGLCGVCCGLFVLCICLLFYNLALCMSHSKSISNMCWQILESCCCWGDGFQELRPRGLDGSVSKALAVQVWGPEVRSSHPHKNDGRGVGGKGEGCQGWKRSGWTERRARLPCI